MSLLIKALDQAAKNKAEDEKNKATPAPTLSKTATYALSPVDSEDKESVTLSLAEEAGIRMDEVDLPSVGKHGAASRAQSTHGDSQREMHTANVAQGKASPVLPPVFEAQRAVDSQQAAASIFKANEYPVRQRSWLAFLLIACAGVLMMVLFWQAYQAFRTFLLPDTIVNTPVSPMPQGLTQGNQNDDVVEAFTNINTLSETDLAEVQAGMLSEVMGDNVQTLENQTAEPQLSGAMTATTEQRLPIRAPATSLSATDNDQTIQPNARQNQGLGANISLTRKAQQDSIAPEVMQAYDAFQRGEITSAQQLYRQALQQDPRNIDALLGMAAVAQRQNRPADAQGWYEKVLENAPKNTVALTALSALQVNEDEVASESRLKYLIAQQPDNAQLHAALGNLYATQLQWLEAQTAYFDASRLSPRNPDYAFNLAVSLEHLNKPQLALVQYQRTLSLISTTNAHNPNVDVVEGRIQALQANN